MSYDMLSLTTQRWKEQILWNFAYTYETTRYHNLIEQNRNFTAGQTSNLMVKNISVR
jgi:hypothetical protein